MTAIDADVLAALMRVPDPCSVAAGAPLSLVDMGLVRGWELAPDGTLVVRVDTTSAGCMMAGHFVAEAEEQLAGIAGVNSVEVVVDPSGDWTPDRISPRGQDALEHRRAFAIAPIDARPAERTGG